MSKLDQIPKATIGSLEEVEAVKAAVLSIRTQIRLAASSKEYPDRRFTIAFINEFALVPEESPVTRAIRDVLTSDNANADASALMTKISNSVRQTHMLYGTRLYVPHPEGPIQRTKSRAFDPGPGFCPLDLQREKSL